MSALDVAAEVDVPAGRPPLRARVRVAALVDYFLPGYKAGGAIRTVGHMAAQLADELDFHIVTRDRDFLDEAPYPQAVRGGWGRLDGTPVRYLAPDERTIRQVGRALRQARPDVLYLNSFLSRLFTLAPLVLLRTGRVPRVPVVVAPRGEFAPGALALNRGRKMAYIRAVRTAGLFRGVLWQASSELEAAEIRQWFGRRARVLVAPDLRQPPSPARPPAPKRAGELRAVYLGRIAANKNLLGALEMLAGVRGDVRLTVYGPIDTPAYWQSCQARIAALPASVRVEYGGVLRPEEVPGALAANHLFLFPSLGENFGHAVLEALLAGLPVLTTDRTPWGGLEAAGAGWALPVEAPDRFRAVLQCCADAPAEEHARRSAAARALGEASARDTRVLEANRALFRSAVQDAAR
ncbi:MAG TPA: glycosyltransferase family 4 protein [Longimicrobium sp.]